MLLALTKAMTFNLSIFEFYINVICWEQFIAFLPQEETRQMFWEIVSTGNSFAVQTNLPSCFPIAHCRPRALFMFKRDESDCARIAISNAQVYTASWNYYTATRWPRIIHLRACKLDSQLRGRAKIKHRDWRRRWGRSLMKALYLYRILNTDSSRVQIR